MRKNFVTSEKHARREHLRTDFSEGSQLTLVALFSEMVENFAQIKIFYSARAMNILLHLCEKSATIISSIY